jgi:hypothetical protein
MKSTLCRVFSLADGAHVHDFVTDQLPGIQLGALV